MAPPTILAFNSLLKNLHTMICGTCKHFGPREALFPPTQPLRSQSLAPIARRFVTPRAMQGSNDVSPSIMQRLTTRFAQTSCAVALSLAMAFNAQSAFALGSSAMSPQVSNDTPFLDLAHVVPTGKIDALQAQLRLLETETGWKVRVLTRFGPSDKPSIEEIRSGWGVDDKTVVVFVDPSSPNIMSFKFGQAVQKIIPRPFFTELQSRYGNLFFIRENGEQAAVDGMVEALDVCFRKGGCRVPPGLPLEQYYFTLGTSVTGGLILGSVLRIDPQGFVQRRWVYGLLFAPLWATLSINFGIGPVVSRTDDLLPVAANVAATVASALLIYFYPQAAKATGLTVDADDGTEL